MLKLVGKGEAGLTDFERMESAKKIGNNRCYSLGTTVEKPKKLCAPAAAGKNIPSNTEYNGLVSAVIEVSPCRSAVSVTA